PEPLSRLLHLPQYRIIPFGSEAILNIRDDVLPSSVTQLAQRALRKGVISLQCKVSPPQILPTFPSRRASTALRGLFRRAPSKNQACFVFTATESAVPVAWITVSRRSEHHRHVEQLQRSSAAPVGAMEALLVHAVEYLQGQGVASLSLGEVPCIIPDDTMLADGFVPERVFRALNRVSKRVLEPRYSPEGLYVFKNKFNPRWEPVHWIIPKQKGVTSFVRTLISTGVIPLIFERETKRFQCSHSCSSNLMSDRI
ncbi:MAG: phosphatidylglycerol lysyltransferase domain-containing protein, partial [Bdellovibrionota bacterium]